MSERGVFAVDRGIFDHPIFAPEPYTEREAWLWLVGAAVWADKRVRVGKVMVDLKRGQLAFALDFYAKKFQWHVSRVRRFLKRLETDEMLILSATRHATQVTICNYDKYAFGRRTGDTQTDEPTDELPTNIRQQEEEKPKITNNKEEKKEPRERVFVDDGWPDDFREQFWNRYPNKVGKPKALAKLENIRKRAVLVDFGAIMAGLGCYIRDKPPDRAWLNPETFLNQDRWADQPAAVAPQGQQNGRRTVHDAANDFVNKIRSIDAEPPSGIRGGTGETPLRLLSSG